MGTVNRETQFVYVQFFMFIRGYGHNSYSSMNVANTSTHRNSGCWWRLVWVCYMIFLLTASFGYFKTLKESSGFMQEAANYCEVCNLNLKYFSGWESSAGTTKILFAGEG